MEKLLLLDSNSLLHRAYYALPGLTDSKGNPTDAIFGFVSMLARLIKEDLQQISEMGGLLGSAFAIRLQGLPDDVMRFARSRRPRRRLLLSRRTHHPN